MSSCSSSSRLKYRHGLLVLSVLLLANNLLPIQTAAAARTQLEPTNWLSTQKGSWPEADGEELSPFYLFNTEGSTQAGVFGFNPKLFSNVPDARLASKWSFYYRYATNSQTTIRLRNQTGHQDRLLDQTDLKWHDGAFTGGDTSQWNSAQFLNFNAFLLAFKNVQVSYTENLRTVNLDRSSVHRFKTGNDTMHRGIQPFASVDRSIRQEKVPSTVYYTGKNGLQVDFTPPSMMAVVITLKLCFIGDGQVYSLTLTPNKARNGCDNPVNALGLTENIPRFVLEVSEIQCEASETGALQSVIIKSKTDSEFIAIWNVPGVVHQLNSSIESQQVYTVERGSKANNGLPYLNLIENGDACYSLVLPSNVVADVYLTLEGLPRGLHLRSITTRGSVCLNEVIALENLKNYQITVALRETATTDFQIVVTKSRSTPFEVLDLITADNQIATLSSGWYFYSPLVNYEIATVSSVSQVDASIRPKHQIEACDVSANCVPLVESTRSGADGKPILSYTIDELSKKIFVNSPLIRFKGDLGGLEFTQNPLLQTVKSFKEQIEKQNNRVLRPVDGSLPTQLHYQILFDESTNYQTEVNIPLDELDFRLISVNMSLEVQSGSGQINLVQVLYNNGWQGEPFVFPPEAQPELLNMPLREMEVYQISTDALFLTSPTDLPFAPTSKRRLSFTLQNIDENRKPGSVLLTLKVVPAKESTVPIFEHPTVTELQKNAPNEIYTWPADNRILPTQTSGLITAWIQSAVKSSVTIEETGLKAQIIIVKPKGNEATPIVYRLLLGQRSPLYSQVDLTRSEFIDTVKSTYRIVDDISKDERAGNWAPNGPFRVAYFIQSTDQETISFQVESFQVKSVQLDSQNCQLGTRQGPADCLYVPVICADGFEVNRERSGFCEQKSLYKQTVIECEETTGCGNIFSTPFLKTTIPAEVNKDDVVLVPYQLYDDWFEVYLKVNRLDTDLAKNDFCVQFAYAAMNSTLSVSLNSDVSSEMYSIDLPRFNQAGVVEERTICASHLSDDPSSVGSLYFHFTNEAIINVDSHYVSARLIERTYLVRAIIDEGIYLDNYQTEQKRHLTPVQLKNLTGNFLNQNQLIEGRHFKLEGNRLVYRMDNLAVQELKATYGENGTVRDSIQTRWIKNYRTQVRLSLKTSDATFMNSSLVDMRAVFSSKQQGNLGYQNKKELFESKMTIFDASRLYNNDYYKVTLNLHLDLSQITQQQLNAVNVKDRFNQLELIFTDFSVDDPCVADDGQVKVCTTVDRGACGRKYKDFTSVCDCYTGYHGDQCQN